MVPLCKYVLGDPFQYNELGGARVMGEEDEATGRAGKELARDVCT